MIKEEYRDATPEEVDEWQDTDYFMKGDFDPLQLFVVIPTIVQIFMFGSMLLVFKLNDAYF
jgi:hypothetical protein